MTAKKDLKRRVRERQAQTGESYVTARRHVVAQSPDSEHAPSVPLQAEPKGPVIHVDEMHDITEAAAKLGWRCRVTITQSLLDRANAAHVLDKIRALLAATTSDPAMERFRTVLLKGERVPLPKIPRGFWMEQMRAFLTRAHAGIGGISEQGDCLALVIDGTMVLAHIGYWPRPPREHAAPRLSLSAIGPATEGLDSMSVLFS